MTGTERKRFQQVVMAYYHSHGRHELPWRLPEADGSFDPYKILVSELMLQQTQVPRVISKFQGFMARFPSLQALARATLGDVLTAWSGLGYNRRAKYLQQAAQKIMIEHGGIFPQNVRALTSLPGVGKNTAGAILAYAFNQPVVFVETNIRTVYLHHFFHDQVDISDDSIRFLVEHSVDIHHPREWYWALMDYGSYLKQTVGNLNTASVHYTKQSKFQGSRRQIRGAIIRALTTKPLAADELKALIVDDRLPAILKDLVKEGMITKAGGKYELH